jgi:hypothetical protein
LALEAESGLARNARFGIYGGMSPEQRAKLAKGMAA